MRSDAGLINRCSLRLLAFFCALGMLPLALAGCGALQNLRGGEDSGRESAAGFDSPEGGEEAPYETSMESYYVDFAEIEAQETAGDAGETAGNGNGDAASATSYTPHYPEEAIVMTGVNARSEMDANSPVISTLMEGESVTLTGGAEGWYSLEHNGQSCWVVRKYVIPLNYINSNSTAPGQPVSLDGIDTSRPMVALSFDDGPRAETTNRILDALQSVGAHATFFMMGGRVKGDNNDCVKRMLALGCELGNHTYNHEAFNTIPASKIRPDVRMADYMIEETCGQAPSVLRPPGGAVDAEAAEQLRSLGIPAILWSIDTRDWETRDADNTYRTVMENVRDGDIVLMHDTYEETADAAVRIIPELAAAGYQLVTVSELAASRGQALEGGVVYSQFWK